MMRKLPWLPEYAKAEDASAFLEMATGEAWPLARILEAGAGAFVLIAPPEGSPQAALGGRAGCFFGPILRQDDLLRLAHSPGDATMHMTQTPEGRVISFNPPARFTSAEVRLHAADVRRIAEMFPGHEVEPSRHSEVLRLDGFDVTFAEGHSLRQFVHLHGGIPRIELVESPPVLQSPEPAQAAAAPAAPEVPDSASAPAVVHRVGNRAHPLDGVIAEACRRAVRDDWLTVWGELTRMAERPDRPAPLMGYAPGDGLQVRSDDPEGFRCYSKDAFRQHWRRRNKG